MVWEGEHPLLMGILNVTPDSFSDGGRFLATDRAVQQAFTLLDEGADLLDIGGESTRPGAAPVGADEEIRRVVPVIQGVLARLPNTVISIDTSKARVAAAALEAGACIVNDVTALGDPEMPYVVRDGAEGVALMHMRGTPRTMQRNTRYDDVVDEVSDYLRRRIDVALSAGVRESAICIDPGIGFGKSFEANCALIAATDRFAELGYPVLVGASRKAFIGALTGVTDAADRVFGSVGAAIAAASRGAAVLRVHDVAATRQALTVWRAVESA